MTSSYFANDRIETMSINSSNFGDLSVSVVNVSNPQVLKRHTSCSSLVSSTTSSSSMTQAPMPQTPHATLPASSHQVLEETTFVTKTFTFKWNLIGYPFATAPMKSENFSPPDSPGDIWFLHLDPPKLRVEKGVSMGSGTSNITSVYSTSSLDLKELSPSVRFSDGFDYYTDVKLSLNLKRKGMDNMNAITCRRGMSSRSDVRESSNTVTAGFEISIASNQVDWDDSLSGGSSSSGSNGSKRVVHFSWVAFNESFAPFSEYPSKTFSFKGKITELVNVHRLTSLSINCQLFYNPSSSLNHLSPSLSSSSSSGVESTSSSKSSNGGALLTRKGFADEHFYFGQNEDEKFSLSFDLKVFFSNSKLRKNTTDIVMIGTDGAVNLHKVILMARSSVFRERFEKDPDIASSGQINVFGVSVKVLKKLVNFLYNDQIPEEELKEVDYDLFLLSDKYKIPKLKSLAEISIAKGINEMNCGQVMALCRNMKSAVIQRKLHEFFNQ